MVPAECGWLCGLEDRAARRCYAILCLVDFALTADIVCEREAGGGVRYSWPAPHCGLKFLGRKETEEKTVVDLDEEDHRQVERRLPTQALHVETTRRLEVSNAERQKVMALLHRCIMPRVGEGKPTRGGATPALPGHQRGNAPIEALALASA